MHEILANNLQNSVRLYKTDIYKALYRKSVYVLRTCIKRVLLCHNLFNI